MYNNGHFHSPCVNLDYIREFYNDDYFEYFNNSALNVNLEHQKNMLLQISEKRTLINFKEFANQNDCYYHANKYFRYADAWIYSAMVLHLKPKKIIEIGSGFSTALAIDINTKYFNSEIEITSIDPFQQRLTELIKNKKCNVNIKSISVTDIDSSYFKILKKNDILFIDSSHVLKQGSDVNYILFEILPILNEGVIIHFHDVFLFNYPKSWFLQDISWNESYALRAFLSYNYKFDVLLLNKLVTTKLKEDCMHFFPELLVGHGGSSLYIQKK